MLDLSTTYLGLRLKNPLVASSGPLCKDVGNLLKLEDAGVSAVVLHSLFEEQINLESQELDRFLSEPAEQYAEALSYFPDMTAYNIGPDGYVEHIRRAKEALDIPVIGSLNGISTGGWIKYAKLIEDAGADALELNIYYLPTRLDLSAPEVEKMYADLVSHVKASIGIPVAVKLGPYFSSIPNVARQLDACGADGLVLFNRFYQPDFNLEDLEVVPNLVLSNSHELLLRLHWVAILYGNIKADMAITGGVHTAEDVVKSMMAGARVAMTTSALLRHGVDYAETLQTSLVEWMMDHEYESIRQMQGSMSARSVSSPAAFERANYMKVLSSYTLRAAVR
ncbi:MAG: dihydroorotate dehydrogenase-like protein [Bryobacteraceae bacterium]|nr:dihydroorotate dehydrogenase-like protein [Bryobacterales bacterium]MEB2359966.1 dihydroorotate dehydrogenase-like protein [Bryobacterales bacterium]NUN01335.1 dihydroorotate dehydrogenase-like protein [Bryobacteraceae bacterium]